MAANHDEGVLLLPLLLEEEGEGGVHQRVAINFVVGLSLRPGPFRGERATTLLSRLERDYANENDDDDQEEEEEEGKATRRENKERNAIPRS